MTIQINNVCDHPLLQHMQKLSHMWKILVVWWGNVGYVAILFGGTEYVLVGWLEGVDIVMHDVLLGTCLEARATWRCWLQDVLYDFGCLGSGVCSLLW